MRLLVFSLLLAGVVLNDASVASAQSQPKRFWAIELDDGSGGFQQLRYEEEDIARMREARRQEREREGLTPLLPQKNGTASASPPPVSDPALLKDRNLSLTLEDGRKLPFALGPKTNNTSGGKSDGTVDAYGTLRNLTQMEDNLTARRFDGAGWQGGSRATLSGEDRAVIDWGQWQSKFNAWGGRETSSIELKDTLDAERRDMPRLEQKRYDRSISPWSREFAEFRNVNQRIAQERSERYLSDNILNFGDRMREQYKSLETASMQDINKYQFRRSHSTESGLPAVSPGGEVRTDRFKRNN